MSRIPLRMAPMEDMESIPDWRSTVAGAARGGTSLRNWIAAGALLLAAAGAQAQAVFATPQPVGTTAGQQGVTVTAKAAGTVGAVEVLTLGAPNLDFTAGTGFTCQGAALAVNAACTQSVFFTPAAPGLRLGAVVLLDAAGNVLGSTYISGTGSGGLGVFVPGNILPVAGDGNYKDAVADGIPATQAELYLPSSAALDGAGNLYIADTLHNRIRMVCSSATSATIFGTGVSCTGAGIISTIAGNDAAAYGGDHGPAANATLNLPSGVAIDGAGNLYIADTGNSVIREIAAATGIISTVAGNGTAGYGGDGLAALSPTAELNAPQGVTLDFGGNLTIADTANQRIRRVDAVTGILTTVAGNGFTNPNGSGGYNGDGMQAVLTQLNGPDAAAFDSLGNMYIADSLNNRVRMVAPSGIVSTFAGTGAAGYTGDGGAAGAAELRVPSGVIADPANNVYVADTQNAAIRKVSSPSSPFPGVISTVAANGVGEYLFDGILQPVSLYGPIGLLLDGSGDLYFADSLNMAVREIQSNFVALDFTGGASPTPVRQGSLSPTQAQTVENDGNATLDLTSITAGTNAALDAAKTSCNNGATLLSVAFDCGIGAVFAPSTSIPPTNPEIGSIEVAGAAVNSPLDIELIGDATAVNSTTTALTSSNNPSGFGQSVPFTATVSTGPGTGNLTGTVSFFDGASTLIANVPLNAPGATATATFSITTLSVGLHSVTAIYNANDAADPAHFSSTSLPLTQTVQEATVTSLVSSANPSPLGVVVTFTATVTIAVGGGIAPDGFVTFTDGNTTLAIIAVGAGGVAAFTTATPLTQGVHQITASYGGDAAKQIEASSSVQLSQNMQASSSIVLNSNPNPSTYGTPVTFTVTVTPGGAAAPTGFVTILDGGQAIGTTGSLAGSPAVATFTTSSLAVGSHIVTASYPGDANNTSSVSQAITQTVTPAQTATGIAAAPNPGIAGAPVTITASVKVTSGAAAVTGSVAFTDTFNGATAALGSASLGAAGTAAIKATLAAGQHSIVATYSGDPNSNGSASIPLPLTVALAATSTVVTATPNPSSVQVPVTFTAKVTGNGGIPTGTVTFLADGTAMGAAVSLDGTGTAAFTYAGLAVGAHRITAVYAGDANDSPSTSAAITQTVQQIPTVTDLGVSATTGANPIVILVAAVLNNNGSPTPTPTGTVTFNNGTAAIGSATLDSSGVATLTPSLGPGSYNIVAVYSGDTNHSPSTSAAVSVSGTGYGFLIAVNPASVTLATTKNTTVAVTLTSESGFTDTIGLGCASLPAGVTCHFSSDSVALAANGVSTSQLTIDTDSPLSGGAAARDSHAGSRGVSLAGLLLPLGALFGLLFWRFRKRHAAVFIAILLLSVAAIVATGCSGISSSSAAPGTYVIQVTGVGTNSGVTHYQNVTLNITK